MSLCACMGPIGKDPLCPCAMTRAGLTPTPLWTEEKKEELRKVFEKFNEEKKNVDSI